MVGEVKMRYLLNLVLTVTLIFTVGCAVNVYTQYPYPDSSVGSGRIIIKLTQSVKNVNVTIDGSLVVEDAHTKRIEIKGVPVGERMVGIVGSSQDRTASISLEKIVIIRANQDEVILIDTPPLSSGYWIYLAVFAILFQLALGGNL